MKTMFISPLAAFVLLFTFLPVAHAEVQLITVNIEAQAANTYVVPAGKVFILEWVGRNQGAGDHATVSIAFPGGGFTLLHDYVGDGSVGGAIGILPRPMKFIGGISFTAIGSPGNNKILTGLLVDPEDIYAATVPNTFGTPQIAGGVMTAPLKQSSPRPTVVRVESSSDLLNWTADLTAEVANTADKTEKVVTVAASEPRKFVRAKVVSRSQE